eukprot:gene5111-8709_t
MTNSGQNLTKESAIHIAAGAWSGIFSDFFVHPLDVIVTRDQASTKQSPKLLKQFGTMVKNEGIPSLWKGFSSVLLGSIPGHAAYFFGYEFSKTVLNNWIHIENDDSPIVHFISGLSADVFSSFIYTPSDIVKQHLQMEQEDRKKKYTGNWDCIKKIYKNHGLKNGLFKGYMLNMLSDAPTSAFYFVGYEQLKILAKNMLNKKSVDDLPGWVYLTCGGVTSGFLTGVFNPLDVIRIRLQVTNQNFEAGNEPYKGFFHTAAKIAKEEGYNAFWKGITPSVLCVSIGTAITMVACKFYVSI